MQHKLTSHFNSKPNPLPTFFFLLTERERERVLSMPFRSQSFIPNLMFWTLTESCNFWSSISFKTESKLARYTSHFLRARSSWCASFWILLSCSSCRHLQCSFTPFKTNEKRKRGGWGCGGDQESYDEHYYHSTQHQFKYQLH